MDEGSSALGVWLPLALSDIYELLVIILRTNLAEPRAVDVPKRSKILASWCLPMLSKALAADEAERDALQLLEQVKKIKSIAGKCQSQHTR